MLLYFDTYLTDQPRSHNRKLERMLSDVRQSDTSYHTQRKVDIFKYTLASFSPLRWDEIVINVDGDSETDVSNALDFAKNLFPTAQLAPARSDTGTKYGYMLANYVEADSWIFFSPHNDHPYIGSEQDAFSKFVDLAEECETKFNLPVVILYSHFTESVNSLTSDRFLYGFAGECGKILFQTEHSYVVLREVIPLLSTHIIRARQLYNLMLRAGQNRVITTECLGKYFEVKSKCIQIVPKMELCRHYDGYMHTYSVVRDYVSAERVPPLFIPQGFFENQIHIKYGYTEYYNGCTNINPNINKYIFRCKSGTDLGVLLSDMPLFWRARILRIDINPTFVEPLPHTIELVQRIYNPWRMYPRWKINLSIMLRKCSQFFHRSVIGTMISDIRYFAQKTSLYFYVRGVYRWFLRHYSR